MIGINIHGQNLSKMQAISKTGRLSQLCGTKVYRLEQGRSHGTLCVDVDCGEFCYTVVPDRCMDISRVSYKGINLAFQSISGEVAPAYFDKTDWLNSFFAGLLTTCGLTYIGQPCNDEGESLGLHGLASSLPAEVFSDCSHWEGDEYVMELKGSMVEGHLGQPKLRLTRTIRSVAGESRLFITDEIENLSQTPSPLAILYHINPGYPLLDTCAVWHASPSAIEGYDLYSREQIKNIGVIRPPGAGFAEENFLLTMKTTDAWSMIFNPNLGFGLYVRWDCDALPYMTLWQNFADTDYCMGMEPSNCPCRSRDLLRRSGSLPMLAPLETKRMTLEIGVCKAESFV